MLAALDEAVEALEGRADPGLLRRAAGVSTRAGERLRLSGEHTVVALAGSTGSGKSSLFNALAGAELSTVGLRRPTTARAHACVWGAEGAAPLVQWLGVPRRQTAWQHGAVTEDSSGLDGLVLLDLPDHDSTALDHRFEVDRLVELVDLLVWVVDPQKYADRAVHERYLRRLAGHASVTVVVLNQVDTLNPFAAAECVDDLRRLVDADGLARAPVLALSARTGGGLDALRGLLAEAVTRRRARNDRLVADVESVISALARSVSADEPAAQVGAAERQLVDALASSAGVPAIGAAVEQSWRLRAEGTLGWPPTRWVRKLRPDPLRRLHLRSGDRRQVRSMLRSSVPEPSPVQRAQVEHAVRRVCDEVSGGLPPRWQQSVRTAAGAHTADVRDALDRAVVGTALGVDRTPLWWRGASVLQWLLVATALVGAGWLVLLALGGYLQLPQPSTPRWRGLPVPTLLLVGAVLLGLLLAAIGRAAARAAAVARRRRAESRLRSGIESVAREMVIEPVEAELARHARARDALARAAGG
jgi:GTP-binding protein EngB required for normal cell division